MDLRATAADEQRGWWALYTKHQHEKTVADMLVHKGAEVFLPLYETVRHWKDRNVKISVPLFPSYLFVRENPGQHLAIVSTPGIHMIVTHGAKFAIISQLEIHNLKRAVEGPRKVEPFPFVNVGERVRITRGSLEGVEGILLRQKNLCRIIISVDMLGRSAAVEVNAWEIEPIRGAQPAVSRFGSYSCPGQTEDSQIRAFGTCAN